MRVARDNCHLPLDLEPYASDADWFVESIGEGPGLQMTTTFAQR